VADWSNISEENTTSLRQKIQQTKYISKIDKQNRIFNHWSSFGFLNPVAQRCTNIPKNQEPPQNSRHHKGDMIPIPY
jgi:hypothetical protein